MSVCSNTADGHGKASASKIEKASASWQPGFGPCLIHNTMVPKKYTLFNRVKNILHFLDHYQGCDCATNWLILANSDSNFVISEIRVIQVRKCFPA